MSPFLIMLPVQYEVISQATWTQFSLCVQENDGTSFVTSMMICTADCVPEPKDNPQQL